MNRDTARRVLAAVLAIKVEELDIPIEKLVEAPAPNEPKPERKAASEDLNLLEAIRRLVEIDLKRKR